MICTTTLVVLTWKGWFMNGHTYVILQQLPVVVKHGTLVPLRQWSITTKTKVFSNWNASLCCCCSSCWIVIKPAEQCDVIYYIKGLNHIVIPSKWAFALHSNKLSHHSVWVSQQTAPCCKWKWCRQSWRCGRKCKLFGVVHFYNDENASMTWSDVVLPPAKLVRVRPQTSSGFSLTLQPRPANVSANRLHHGNSFLCVSYWIRKHVLELPSTWSELM